MLEKTGNGIMKSRLCHGEGGRVVREIIAHSKDMCQCGCQCDECIELELTHGKDCSNMDTSPEPGLRRHLETRVSCKCHGASLCHRSASEGSVDMISMPTGGTLGDILPPASEDYKANASDSSCNKSNESTCVAGVCPQLHSLEDLGEDTIAEDCLGTGANLKGPSLPRSCTSDNQRLQVGSVDTCSSIVADIEDTDDDETYREDKTDGDTTAKDQDESHNMIVEDHPAPHHGAGCCGSPATTISHVAVFCTFGIMFLTVGVMSSFGVFYVELLDYFGDSQSSTSLIGSINCGVCHAAAPLVGLIEARIGIRQTVVVGGLLSAIGLTGSSFVSTMPYLYFTYGAISGTGFAIAYTASIGVLVSHFDCQRRLDIAVGISTSGMGFGVLALPPVIRFVIDAYGWRGAILLCGGLALNVCVFAVLSGPPREKNELIHILSVGSVAYLRTDKDVLRRDIVSMSMTSVYIMKDTDQTDSNGTYAKNGKEFVSMDSSRKNTRKRLSCLTVIGNKVFLILLISEILSNMTIGTVLTTLPDFAHCNGHSLFRASLLLSIYGTTATMGRLYLSLFSAAIRKFKSHKRITIAATSFITMLSVLCMGFTGENYYLIGLWVGLFGIASGAKGTFVYCFVIKLLGARNTITAMGLVGLSCGIGQFGGPPLAGLLFSVTGWYPAVYCFAAVTSLFAVLCVVMLIIMHMNDRRCKQQFREPTYDDGLLS